MRYTPGDSSSRDITPHSFSSVSQPPWTVQLEEVTLESRYERSSPEVGPVPSTIASK